MSSTNQSSDPTRSESYVIQITGELGEHWQPWFEGMTVEQPGDGTTVLTGQVTDQAALHGLLQRIRDLGLPLIAVTRMSADTTATARPPSDQTVTKGNQQ